MRRAAFEFSADLHDEHGSVFFADRALALGRREIRIAVFKLLRIDEIGRFVDVHVEYGVTHADFSVGKDDRFDDVFHRLFEIVDGTFLSRDDFLPVPLIDENGVRVVYVVVSANGVHIRVDALARAVSVAVKRHSLPFCEGLHDLCVSVHLFEGEFDFAFHAVQIVVDAAAAGNDEGSGYSVEREGERERVLKFVFDVFNGVLRLTEREKGSIILGNGERVRHGFLLSFYFRYMIAQIEQIDNDFSFILRSGKKIGVNNFADSKPHAFVFI